MPIKPLYVVLLIIFVFGGAVLYWLATPPTMPPAQKMEQVLPDDRIPH